MDKELCEKTNHDKQEVEWPTKEVLGKFPPVPDELPKDVERVNSVEVAEVK